MTRWHDSLSESLAHAERIRGLSLVVLLVIAAMSLGALLRRQVRKSWLGEMTKPARAWWLSMGPGALRLAAILLMGIAAADPRPGQGQSDVGRSSEQIVLLLDRSRSMLAADAEPTRLGLAKRVAADVIDRSQGAAIAIVSFAGDARIDSPLSCDDRQLREQLDALDLEQDARPGTLLTQGLKLATDCFASRLAGPKRLIVLTDGETHEPVAPADVPVPRGVDVLFLGIGDSTTGARIPLQRDANGSLLDTPHYLTYQGKTIWTKAHPENLQQLAHQWNGQSHMITSLAEGSRIISAARGAGQQSLRWQRLATATPIYRVFLAAALILLALELLLPAIERLGWLGRSRRQARHTPVTTALLSIVVLCFVSGAAPHREIAETYNRGVEAYQSAAWQEAEAQFRLAMASGDEAISRQARFNLANTQYQQVRTARMSKQEALARLEESIACYRRCIQENERPTDARANLQIVYALLKHIENQKPNNQQSGRDDTDQGSANPPPNNQHTERGDGNSAYQPGEKPGPNNSAGNASRPDKPGPRATSPPPDGNRGDTQDQFSDTAAEDELRRIRDQARRHGAGKKPIRAAPTAPGGPPW